MPSPGDTLTYLLTGGGGDPSDFLESQILAKRGFFGSVKDTGFFGGVVLFISSNEQ